ncbi:hypothetical protein QTP88_020779 [Uroleucon formosanum]
MPRNRVKTTNRGTTSERTMQEAAILCLDNHMSERSAAKKFNICHVSLNRYIKKFKLHRETGICLPAFGYRPHNKIFDDFQEKQLVDYVKFSADMYFGYNSKNIRKLAYEFSVKLDVTIPNSWKKNEEAGPDWVIDFLKRNPSLSSCLPKTTNMTRATEYNPGNVKPFMDKYKSILLKYKFQAHDIYNMDEIGATFVQETGKIVASRGNKHIEAITSDKDGTVSMCLAINAAGILIPPMHTFSKAANNLNFMQGVEFLQILKKFTKYVRPSVNKKVLILLELHDAHLCLPVIEFCREAGIFLLMFPPHCVHKLQPLNRSVYKPFNKFLNQNLSAWIENNPGIQFKTYDVPLLSFSTSALVNAATPQNIIKGFLVSGIWPFNSDLCADYRFTPDTFQKVDNMFIDDSDEESISTHFNPDSKTEESSTPPIFDLNLDSSRLRSPETIRLILKLTSQIRRKEQIRIRKKVKSTILTNMLGKLEMKDETKNNAKRNLVCKNKKSTKSKN